MGIGLFIYLGSRPYSHWPGPALGELRSVVSCISRTERARMAAHASKRLYIVYMMYIQLGCSGALPHCTSRPHFARSMSHRSPQTMRRRHAVVHCKRAARDISELMHAHRTAIASATCSAGLLACPATSARRFQLHNSFLRAGRADVQRVVEEELDLGCTSTPALACDAGTPETLSAGVLGRFEELAHLLCTCSAASLQRELQIPGLMYLSCSATFEFSARK